MSASGVDGLDDAIARQVQFVFAVRTAFRDKIKERINDEADGIFQGLLYSVMKETLHDAISENDIAILVATLGDEFTRGKFVEACSGLVKLREEMMGDYVSAKFKPPPAGSLLNLYAKRDAVIYVERSAVSFLKALRQLPSPEFQRALGGDAAISTTLPGGFRSLLKEAGREALEFAERQAFEPSRGNYVGTGRRDAEVIPAADRFVRIGDNNDDAEAAKEHLSELATEIEQSNTLLLPKEERAVLAAEIRILVCMLEQKVARLAQVQFAIGHDGVLNYLKTRFPDHAIGAAIGKALDLLVKALGIG